jgi:4-hydroxyphenylacetate 3-monooxygenase
MGRAPDYLNRALMSFAAGAEFLGAGETAFAANARACYERVRDEDLCLTHTLIAPQANRAVSAAEQRDPFLAARVKEETDAGIVIRGCRMLATLPFADEIMVFPSTLLKSPDRDAPYAFGFVIPTDTPGLKLMCRESLDYGRSRFDHPLGSRFEEMDAVVVFDDVLVPWERVLLYRDLERCNQAYLRTRAHGSSSRREEHREERVRVGTRSVAGRHDRRRGLSAHPGEARGTVGEPRNDEGAAPRGRSGRRAR